MTDDNTMRERKEAIYDAVVEATQVRPNKPCEVFVEIRPHLLIAELEKRGLVIVPREPTEAMKLAMMEASPMFLAVYQAAIDAAGGEGVIWGLTIGLVVGVLAGEWLAHQRLRWRVLIIRQMIQEGKL